MEALKNAASSASAAMDKATSPDPGNELANKDARGTATSAVATALSDGDKGHAGGGVRDEKAASVRPDRMEKKF